MTTWPALIGTDFERGLARGGLESERVPPAQTGAVTVLLLKSEDLAAWAATVPSHATIDRRRKNPTKQLSYYLPGTNGRCVRLESDYHEPGRAEVGVRAVLLAAAHRKRSGVMVLGVNAGLFDQLWARAADGSPSSAAASGAAAGTPADTGGPDVPDELGRMLDVDPDVRVPNELRKEFVGTAQVCERVRKLIVLAAKSPFPVLIEGETGTGKGIVARQINDLAGHPDGNFLHLNCGGIPDQLLQSELFGHVKGAFSGALRDKVGLWKKAEGGTLFLDEIGDLPLHHQRMILRALDDGHFSPVGSEEEIYSDARIITATHRNLRQMVNDGLFREDLYYRLFALRIRTPAMREHPEDIPLLAEHIWAKYAGPRAIALPATAMAELQRQTWPGNVRELRGFLMSLSAYAAGHAVTAPLVRALFADRRGGR